MGNFFREVFGAQPSADQSTGRRSAGRTAAGVMLSGLLVIGLGACAPEPDVEPVRQERPVPVLPGSDAEQVDAEAPEELLTQELDETALEFYTTLPKGFAPSVVATDATVTERPISDVLESLQVKGRAGKTGYDRTEKFGKSWLDVDKNGCDTRNDILQRDLTNLELAGPCKVMVGTLDDNYSGKVIEFVRGNTTSSLVQIDHIVALSDAWQKGAQQLTQAQRITFANDPLNLVATDGATNASKGDGDAATWLPKNKDFRCELVTRQISVKATYGLWVTPAEKEAMRRVLHTCPADTQGQTSPFTPTPTATPGLTATPAPSTTTGPADQPPKQLVDPGDSEPPVYYKNCTAARAAGAAPVYEGQPGYARHLDRDGDGIGCE